jgi:hypothetical protein
MANILNLSSTLGIQMTGDNSGALTIQNNGANTLSISSSGLITSTYNGINSGLVPGQQMFILSNAYTLANTTSAQSLFGVGVSLSSSTIYKYETSFILAKTGPSTTHSLNYGFGGTANNFYILTHGPSNWYSGAYTGGGLISGDYDFFSNTTTLSPITTISALTTASTLSEQYFTGTISINSGGTFIPQISLSAAAGNYVVQPGSYFSIYPVSTGTANVSIGTWA